MAAGKWVKVGSVLKKKDGQGRYLKINTTVSLTEGMILNIQDPRKRPGITPEQMEKIPDFVVAEIFLPPSKD